MRLSIFVNLVGRCTVCLPFSLWFALPTFTGSQQGGALLLLIHVTRRFYIAITYPPRCRWGLLAIVSRLLAFGLRLLAIVYRLLAIVYRLLATVCRLLLTLATITAHPLAYY